MLVYTGKRTVLMKKGSLITESSIKNTQKNCVTKQERLAIFWRTYYNRFERTRFASKFRLNSRVNLLANELLPKTEILNKMQFIDKDAVNVIARFHEKKIKGFLFAITEVSHPYSYQWNSDAF